jgi:hypothetical protein
LKEQFIRLEIELRVLGASFPKEWQPDYIPEYTSPRLRWVGEGNARRVVWELGIEQEYGWQFLLEHLQTGLPSTFKAVAEVKEAYARYCQRWKELEDRYRVQAQELEEKEPGQVSLKGSYFYRSIVNEADHEGGTPEEEEYVSTPGTGGICVSFAGVQLLETEDEEIAKKWVGRHIEWRKEVLKVYKGELDHLRRDVRAGIEVVVKMGQEFEIGARVAGTCKKCPGGL